MKELKISLAAARVNANMTQDEVAKEMHISKATLGNWENGKNIPGVSQLSFLSNLYGIPMDNIFLPKQSTKSRKRRK
ncbi:helix-turn-helix transcriptional regulator [Roseburia hominis]|uniref:helix-turn-helix domain-containing protein n=1 Tax=Roseburia hominis TaxID=301301 RepID=UPI001F201451|nr:helix-turn-helix transcriptional regulator [Roseburia hominis]